MVGEHVAEGPVSSRATAGQLDSHLRKRRLRCSTSHLPAEASEATGPLGRANAAPLLVGPGHSFRHGSYLQNHSWKTRDSSPLCVCKHCCWMDQDRVIQWVLQQPMQLTYSSEKLLIALQNSRFKGIWRLPAPELDTDLPAAGEAASLERNLQDRVFLFPAGVDRSAEGLIISGHGLDAKRQSSLIPLLWAGSC